MTERDAIQDDLEDDIPPMAVLLSYAEGSPAKKEIEKVKSERRAEVKAIRRITMDSVPYDVNTEHGFRDRLVITKDSIRYDYCPLVPSDKNYAWNWSFNTDSKAFHTAFRELEPLVAAALSIEDEEPLYYFGESELLICYEDSTYARKKYEDKTDEFSALIHAILDLIYLAGDIPEIINVMLWEWDK